MNGLTDWLRHALPKPWLFGLYGALGGLIGALVLGEVLWGVLRPSTKAVDAVPPLRLAISPSLDVYQEGKNQLGVKIAREGWVGPVTMTVVQPPEGIAIAPVIIPEDRSDMQLEVRATTRASIGSSELTLEAQGPPIPGSPRATASARLTVRKAQTPPPGLRLSVSPEVIVDQSGKNRFGVIVARDQFRGPVSVKLSDLPEGVAAGTLTLSAEVSEGEIEVRARANAAAGTTIVAVTATGPDGLAGVVGPISGFSRLNLKVHARTAPPALRLGVSPGVVVDQSRKNRFGVIVARDQFSGPVTLELGGLPNGVTANTLSLPADETSGTIEVAAAPDATVGTSVVSVTATGPGGLPGATVPPKAFSRLDLTVKPFKSAPLKVDIMFVLDVTGSMQWAIDGVRDGIILFAEDLRRRQLDVRVGLTGFRDHLQALPENQAKGGNAAPASKKEAAPLGRRKRRVAPGAMPGLLGMVPMKPLDLAPRLLIVKGESFTKDYGAFGREVGANLVAFGGGAEPESSLDALALASRQSFREDASRVLILITDAPPNIPDLEMQSIEQTVARLRTAKIDQVHLVINDFCRPFFTPLQAVDGGGGVFDLQEAARGRGAFAAMLPTVGQEIARITTASQPPPPPLAESQPPAPPPPASVAAAPLEPNAALAPPPVPAALAAEDLPPISPPPVLRGVQSQETFGTESSFRLLVAIAVWTSAITAMIAMALCAGQHHYLRRGLLPPGAALRGWVGGLIAGMAGGAAGQFLFQVASDIPAGEAVFRILGWTLLGSLAGYVLAFFVPNLRSDRGMLGGAVGGAAGALGFLGAAFAVRGLPGGDAAGRVLGAVLLGLALGLMLALAERIARTAWLEVQYGGGESRTVNLGVEPVSLGSNSRASTIYARGAAPVAYRYWFLDGKVKQHDVVSGAVTELRPDNPQSVGAVIVTVRTAATTKETRTAPVPAAPVLPVARTAIPAPQIPPAIPKRVASSAPIVPPTPAPVAVASAAGPGVTPRKDSSSCPGCGQHLPGAPGNRYCIRCDLYL